MVRVSDRISQRMPVVRNNHSALKQSLETVLAQQSKAFRQVVLLEYPRRGIWTLGFITGDTAGEVQSATDQAVLNVFVPTPPKPTTGFLPFVPRSAAREIGKAS